MQNGMDSLSGWRSLTLLTKIEKSAGKPVIHGNRIANVRLYQGLKAYEGI